MAPRKDSAAAKVVAPLWLKLSVAVPAPNSTLAASSVPAETAESPAAAPILIVPTLPEFTPRPIVGALTVPPAATVSLPLPE